ncbi:IS200/IS605 family transposase [Candidatus Poribacteria bacterium]|nr:IS200/IS605 family transposase [Candidatus Poribacteria bacterium]
MPNTYTQLYVHIVFAVKGRQYLLPKAHKDELHRYITGIITNKKQKVIQINSMPDHIHILVGLAPEGALTDLVRDIKANSSRFINEKRWVVRRFEWQKGFSAFSYSHSQLDAVAKYIRNQELHHSKKTFREEYLELLDLFGIAYDRKYVFESETAEYTV